MFEKGFLKGKRAFLGVLAFAIPTSILSSIISAYVFKGITSSGSSYIVQILSGIGVNKVVGVFTTQFFTDYTDKFIAVLIVNSIVSVLPTGFIKKLKYYSYMEM